MHSRLVYRAGLLSSLAALSHPFTAHADRGEASLHAHAIGGVASTGDQATTATGTTPLGGAAIRGSYATSNLFQYDAQLTLATTGAAAFDRGTFRFGSEPIPGIPFELTTRLVRLDVGATFRLGVRYIPTARIAIGVQERFRAAPIVFVDGTTQSGTRDRQGDTATDLVAVGAVGFDYRINRRLIAGASLGGSLAVPLGGTTWRTLELSAHLSYYWYPLWFE